jgi:uncharacterized membrane protein
MITLASLRFFDVVLFLHVASVVVAFGVLFTYPLVVPLTLRTAPRHIAWLHRVQAQTRRMIVTPAATLVLLTGVYLAADYPGGNVFSEWWVSVPLIAIIVLLGLGGAFFAPRERRLAELAERDIAGAPTEGAVRFGEDYERLSRLVARVGAASALLVLAVIFVMVVGPSL